MERHWAPRDRSNGLNVPTPCGEKSLNDSCKSVSNMNAAAVSFPVEIRQNGRMQIELMKERSCCTPSRKTRPSLRPDRRGSTRQFGYITPAPVNPATK